MSRSKDIAEILGLTEAENTTNASLGDGSGGGGSGVTAYSHDSSGGLLLESTTDHTDGSLHWLGALNELYVWDSAATKYYLMESAASLGLGEASPTLRGTVAGYSAGGYPVPSNRRIQKFSFTSDGNSTEYGEMINRTQNAAGVQSSTHAYSLGGGTSYGVPSTINNFYKFDFATSANSTSVGTLVSTGGGGSQGRQREMASTCDGNEAFLGGGRDYQGIRLTRILKVAFASDTPTDTTDDLATSVMNCTGCGSTSDFYSLGGTYQFGNSNLMQKYAKSSGSDASDIGDMARSFSMGSGNSSETDGYVAGGSPSTNAIEKFPFATNANATDVADLTTGRYFKTSQGASSTTHGYASGGNSNSNVIDKFPFSANSNASDVGNLGNGGTYGMSNHNN
jgi:hypothetical protein